MSSSSQSFFRLLASLERDSRELELASKSSIDGLIGVPFSLD